MKLLGDFFVWEEGHVTYTLDRAQIMYVYYYPEGVRGDKMVLYVYTEHRQILIAGANAKEFWRLWMAYLEEEEECIARIRQADEEWRAREAGPDTPPGP